MRKIILRPARPGDLALIRRFHADQNEKDGTTYPLPIFFGKDGSPAQQVPVSLVGVEEGSDEAVQGIWIERRAELMFAGCDPKATAFARRDIAALGWLLSQLGYSGVHCDVPVAVVNQVSKPLEAAGFELNDHRLAHFFKDLRGKQQ